MHRYTPPYALCWKNRHSATTQIRTDSFTKINCLGWDNSEWWLVMNGLPTIFGTMCTALLNSSAITRLTERLIESPFENFVRAYKKLKIAWTKFSLRVLLSLPTIQWKFLHRLNGTRTHDLSVEFFYFL